MACPFTDWYRGVSPLGVKLLTEASASFSGVRVVERAEQLTSEVAGMLLFSSGVALQAPTQLRELVAGAVENGCAGIVLHLGAYIRYIPRDLIDLCAAGGAALFSAPEQVSLERLMAAAFELQQSASFNEAVAAVFTDPDRAAAEETLRRAGFSASRPYRVAALDAGWNVCLPAGLPLYRTSEAYAVILREDDLAAFQTALADHTGDYVIGHPFLGAAGVLKSYHGAVFLLSLKRRMDVPQDVHLGEEMTLFLLADGRENDALLRRMREDYYAPLARSDQCHGTDHRTFLREYLRHDGQIGAIAAALGIHRNTVLYRVRRVETLLCCRLSEPSVKTYLSLVLCHERADLPSNKAHRP